ncbi:MAG: branched-chain amino acid ABC transporter permease [Alphaproteobacteria bacterium]|nr:branched-chain amino acid ABC transporter permease [Alphaproteobacteria bacterium]
MDPWTTLAQLIVNGLAAGCVYGLVALGFALVYKATEVVNFAQGDLLMVAAFAGWTLIEVAGLPYAVAFPVTVLLLAVLGFGLDRVVVRPILGRPQFATIMLTIGIAFAMRGVVSMTWGPQARTFETPFSRKNTPFFDVVLSDVSLSIIAATAVLSALLFAFFRWSWLGIAMQSASQNQMAAYLMGIPVKAVTSLTWALSASVAACAGLLLAPIALVDIALWLVILKAFAAAVLGGFGSIPGAIVGGLLIGLVEQFVGVYLLQEAKGIAGYVVLLAVLLVWPRGLFGGGERKRV